MRQQLTALREKMQQAGVDAYFIPTTDFHGSEYVNDYFKCRKFVSGFSGSAGTLVVTPSEAWLWTDGRYFLQAEKQLQDTGIGLMKMGEPGVPSIEDYLFDTLGKGGVLGLDGRVLDFRFGRRLEEKLQLRSDLDLVGDIWTDRPAVTPGSIYALPIEVTGETAESKLARVRSAMRSTGADYHLMTKLEEIAWLFNLRGSDIEHTPVFFSFALITQEHAFLYRMDETFSGEDVRPYFQIFEDIKRLEPGAILLDESIVSYALVRALPDHVRIINERNPVELMKALKNETEISCTRNAHLKDGAAMANFIYWLKAEVGCRYRWIPISELSAADFLKVCRKEQEGFYDLSFSTISGYMENGAIIHYDPTPETNKILKPEGFLLVDSGGQYRDGTTDITRTIALGPLTQQMKEHYTAVLRSHIRLAMAAFPAGTTGAQLDRLARQPLQELGLDYNHGTGHGVGHLLSVHEGPQTISPKAGSNTPIYPGMITSNEPGVYLEGQYGIRLENELLCMELPDGSLGFDTLTCCPFDRDAILPERLKPMELAWLNNYHFHVRVSLRPLICREVADWLMKATEPIKVSTEA